MNQAAQVHLHPIPRYAGPRTWTGLTFRDDHWSSSSGSEQRRLPGGLLRRLAAELRGTLAGNPQRRHAAP
jgi:diadenosine tetraphosphate (Ap4A) HIT family hydrolase